MSGPAVSNGPAPGAVRDGSPDAPEPSAPVAGTSGSDGARSAGRRHRRVIALSALDAARVAQGLEPLEVAEERRRRSVDALTDALGRDSSASEHANDARLLGDVPPHWGHGPAIG